MRWMLNDNNLHSNPSSSRIKQFQISKIDYSGRHRLLTCVDIIQTSGCCSIQIWSIMVPACVLVRLLPVDKVRLHCYTQPWVWQHVHAIIDNRLHVRTNNARRPGNSLKTYWRTRSGTHQLLHISAITSDLGNPHVTSVLQPHHYSTDQLPELTSPTARSVAPLLPSGTLW